MINFYEKDSMIQGDDFNLRITLLKDYSILQSVTHYLLSKISEPVELYSLILEDNRLSSFIDLTGRTITSDIMLGRELIDHLDVTNIDLLTGSVTLSKPNSFTINWEPRVYTINVKTSLSGNIVSSDSFKFTVNRVITK
jgi:hypothetical protein